MFEDVFKHLNDLIDSPKNQIKETTPLDSIADEAAEAVELHVVEDERHCPAMRQPVTEKWLEPEQDTVAIDITDSIQAEVEYWGEGSYVHYDDSGDVRVGVEGPLVYLVDADGKRIPGGRIMAEWPNITIDTP